MLFFCSTDLGLKKNQQTFIVSSFMLCVRKTRGNARVQPDNSNVRVVAVPLNTCKKNQTDLKVKTGVSLMFELSRLYIYLVRENNCDVVTLTKNASFFPPLYG